MGCITSAIYPDYSPNSGGASEGVIMLEMSHLRTESSAHENMRALGPELLSKENSALLSRLQLKSKSDVVPGIFDGQQPFMLVCAEGDAAQKAKSERIDKLIEQLGSNKFKERETASKAIMEEGRDA